MHFIIYNILRLYVCKIQINLHKITMTKLSHVENLLRTTHTFQLETLCMLYIYVYMMLKDVIWSICVITQIKRWWGGVLRTEGN
jgi:hypothetical protein